MKRSSSQPTIAEIARLAGTSPATVSRVLGGRNSAIAVSEKTRRRVLEIADELQYRPNHVARSLASGKSRAIGVYLMYPDRLRDPNISEIMAGTSAAVHELGYSITWYFKEKDMPPPVQVADGRVDGALILEDQFLTPEEMQSFRDARIPIVFVGRYGEDEGVNFVAADDTRGIEAAVEHLVAEGHRAICHLFATSARAGIERRNSFLNAAKTFGIEDTATMKGTGFSARHVEETVIQDQESPNPPTAYVCVNDMVALATLRALARVGKHVPRDVAVVGFNDSPFAAYTYPALTTVRRPLLEMGKQAATMLISLINKEPLVSTQIVLPTKLVVRESSARSVMNGYLS